MEDLKQLEPFNQIFESLEYFDKTKPREKALEAAKLAVLEEMKKNQYGIGDEEFNGEKYHVVDKWGTHVYIENKKLNPADFIRSVIAKSNIGAPSEAETLASIKKELLELKEQTRDKRWDKFKARANELYESQIQVSKFDPVAHGQAIQARIEQIESEEELRQASKQEREKKNAENEYVFQKPLPEKTYDNSKFVQRFSEL